MFKKILITLALVSILAIPVMVFADSYGLDLAAPQDLKSTRLGTSVPQIVGGIVGAGLSLIGIVFFLLILYAGFLWMTALGNATKADKAKEIMEAAAIGLVIVLSAYAITTFLFSKIANGGAGTGSSGTGATSAVGCCTASQTNILKENCSGDWTASACASTAKTGQGVSTELTYCCCKVSGAWPATPPTALPAGEDNCNTIAVGCLQAASQSSCDLLGNTAGGGGCCVNAAGSCVEGIDRETLCSPAAAGSGAQWSADGAKNFSPDYCSSISHDGATCYPSANKQGDASVYICKDSQCVTQCASKGGDCISGTQQEIDYQCPITGKTGIYKNTSDGCPSPNVGIGVCCMLK